MKEAKDKMTQAVKLILPKVKDCQFFTGESANPDGMIALLEYREDANGVETPLMLFIKHGLEAEKV